METLKFDEGFREYDINGDASRIVRFRVDPNLKERVEKAMTDIEQLRAKYGNMKGDDLYKAGVEFREIINRAFDSDICTPAFGNASPFAIVGGGKMLYEAFLEALLPALEKEFRAVQTETRPEVKKYLGEDS